MKASISDRLLTWYDGHGRHDLPWQQRRTLYRVWVSEIMLQQTQVKTVIPYYRAFMQRFPSLAKLAGAGQDEVLRYWAGLGYYSRARNLHRAAQQVVREHGGRMPRTPDGLMALPGIGRSTAAAILALALDDRHPILDGNVKRVLARYHAVAGWPGRRKVEHELWRLADAQTPSTRNRDYTQAIMDLGATLCTRSRPVCEACPLHADCRAYRAGETGLYPGRKPARMLPVKASRFLLLIDSAGAIMLEKRPPSGIWGGLWSLPEAAPGQDIAELCRRRWELALSGVDEQPSFRHTFSHYHLDIHPCRCAIEPVAGSVNERPDIIWHHRDAELPAVPAPVARLIASLRSEKRLPTE